MTREERFLKMRAERIGEKFVNNDGCPFEITDFRSSTEIDIKFEDGTMLYNRKYCHIVEGKVRNPCQPRFKGIRFFGVGIYNSVEHTKAHNVWGGIVDRCCTEAGKMKSPTYVDCIIYADWTNFQNFAKWYEENKKEDFEVDKDILIKGNKIYSPETCCFVPREINLLFTKRQNRRGKYAIGVIKNGNKFRATISVEGKNVVLGSYDTEEEAFQAYKKAKEERIKFLANKYREQITEECYWALMNYQVEKTD